MKRFILGALVAPFFLGLASAAAAEAKPNIVLMVADDLGYGDLGSYGATLIKTPRLDRLAAEGVRFTDSHSISSVCDPSRYAILSGTYMWHARLRYNYALYFHEGQITLPGILKSAGYHTVALGKWHNGFGRGADEPDWNGELKPGPLEIGFDYFFGTPRTHDGAPLVFIENHRVVGLDPADPIRLDRSPQFGPHGKIVGGAKAAAARPDERIDLIVTEKATEFIAQQSEKAPFFLYLAFTAPHMPINPAPQFRGKSKAGTYGDFVQELDYCAGLVLDALEKHGFEKNTLVIFGSDNGGVLFRNTGNSPHRSNGSLLGQKTDVWEGGHRVPMLARWPGHIPPGTVRKELFSQVDIMATLAEAAQITMPAGASPDGASELAAFTRPETAPAKRNEAAFLGVAGFALRQGDWIYLPMQGSGGGTAPHTRGVPWKTTGFRNSDIDEDGRIKPGAPPDQLYNLADDIAQAHNLTREEPERAAAMHARMKELKLNFTVLEAIGQVSKPKCQDTLDAHD
ncbi:MAG: arylsulfatase [Blastocatellia bacterium]|nr:arylsulfatase [Blastocatellia bacterium]